MPGGKKKCYDVLIADDSEDDRLFLRRAIDRFPRFQVIGEVGDGVEAIAYLSGMEAFSDRKKFPLPDLMLLDLKMPRKTGFEVLNWLRSQSIPGLTVIVLSGSNLADDVGASLALGAHGFWSKSADKERQNRIAGEIESLLDQRYEKRLQMTPVESTAFRSPGKTPARL